MKVNKFAIGLEIDQLTEEIKDHGYKGEITNKLLQTIVDNYGENLHKSAYAEYVRSCTLDDIIGTNNENDDEGDASKRNDHKRKYHRKKRKSNG